MKKFLPWLILTGVFACLAVLPAKGDTYYKRVRVEIPGTQYWTGYGWSYSAPSYRYEYREANVPAPVVVKKTVNYPAPVLKPPVFAPGWKEKALDLARQRDEYQSYLKVLDQLGYHGQPYGYSMTQWTGYGAMPTAAGYGGRAASASAYSTQAVQLGYFGVGGNTTYGYSFNSLKDPYGSLDLNTLYQQAARLTQGAQQLAGQGNSDFASLVNQAGSNAARVAEILARAEAASKALNAARGDPLAVQTAGGSGVVVNPVSPVVSPVERARAFLAEVGMPRCGKCHSGGTGQKGAFNILAYPSMTPEQKRLVYARIDATDDKVMPPRTSGITLTQAENRRFKEQ